MICRWGYIQGPDSQFQRWIWSNSKIRRNQRRRRSWWCRQKIRERHKCDFAIWWLYKIVNRRLSVKVSIDWLVSQLEDSFPKISYGYAPDTKFTQLCLGLSVKERFLTILLVCSV